jgi:hypothetical protein
MRRNLPWIVSLLIFGPILLSLIVGKEYWPITSFPMYSKPYKRFKWPSVLVRGSANETWQTLHKESCYGQLGYVRFHFSMLRFSSEGRKKAIDDLALSLTKQIRRYCAGEGWQELKIVMLSHDVDLPSDYPSNLIGELTSEVRIAP